MACESNIIDANTNFNRHIVNKIILHIVCVRNIWFNVMWVNKSSNLLATTLAVHWFVRSNWCYQLDRGKKCENLYQIIIYCSFFLFFAKICNLNEIYFFCCCFSFILEHFYALLWHVNNWRRNQISSKLFVFKLIRHDFWN